MPARLRPRNEVFRPRFIVLYTIISGLILAGCGTGGTTALTSSGSPAGLNPIPAITSISPTGATAGGAPFVLTISGANFKMGLTIAFGTTVISNNIPDSATKLLVPIPAAAIAAAGTIPVTVTNPAPGGGTSNVVNFTDTNDPKPIPTITSISPICAPVGAQSFTLEVNGSNFVNGSAVRWNGSDRPTTVFSAVQLIAQISAGDTAASGTPSVTVFNPSPGGGSSTSSSFNIATGGMSPESIVVEPTGKFAYVANEGCPGDFSSNVGNVSMYAINPTTGALASIGSPVAADFVAKSVTVDPSGKFAYVANDGNPDVGSVSMYTIDAATGLLKSIGTIKAPCAPPPSPGSCAPWSVAVHPSGKFAYVANEAGFAPTSVSIYSIDTTTGALKSIGLIAAGGRANSVTVDPTGKFAYVALESNSISMFTINSATGVLTANGIIAAGTNPNSIVIDPSGKFAYVTNGSSNDISMYDINTTTGGLISMGPIAAGTGPSSMAMDPAGKFLYVTSSSNGVLMYTINAGSGALTPAGTIAAGVSPSSIAVDPSGKFAYITNSGSNNVSMFSIDPATGLLTLIGTIGT